MTDTNPDPAADPSAPDPNADPNTPVDPAPPSEPASAPEDGGVAPDPSTPADANKPAPNATTAAMNVTDPASVAGLGGHALPGEGTQMTAGEGEVVTGVNSADGAPVLNDPTYVAADSDQTVAQQRTTLASLNADPDATEAEKSSGERTLTSAGPLNEDGTVDLGVADAVNVGMATAFGLRKRGDFRAVLLERPVRAEGKEGGVGDYLIEDQTTGERRIVTQGELDDEYVRL